MPVEQREMFVVGAKTRLRDLFRMFDAAEIPEKELSGKVEAMAQQILFFVDNIVLPCLQYEDHVIQLTTREDLLELSSHLGQKCEVVKAASCLVI